MRRRLLAILAMAGVLTGSVLLGGTGTATTSLADKDGDVHTTSSSQINRGW